MALTPTTVDRLVVPASRSIRTETGRRHPRNRLRIAVLQAHNRPAMKRANGAFPSANLLHDGGQMSKSISDELLQEFSRGFAFEKSPRQQLNFEQMIALADMLIGWALDERTDPKRSAWLIGVAEGLLAEADLLGPDWNPPEPEELSLIGFLGQP